MNTKSLMVYCAIAVVVAVVVAAVLLSSRNHSYSIDVRMLTNSTATLYPYQTSSFVVYVNNTGPGEISGMPFIVYLNGNQFKSYTITLPAGRGGEIPFNYTYPYNGTYQFSAVADPAHVFQISDRAGAQSALSMNVLPAQKIQVLSSIQNSNVSGLEGFAITQPGISVVPTLALGYDISMTNSVLGPAHTVMLRTLQDLADTVASASGATATYSNNGVATSIWLNGTVTPVLVAAIVNSFSIPQKSIQANGTPAYFARVSNTTSVCFFYSKGWTKVISYYNASTSLTCANIVATAHNDTQSARLKMLDNTTPRLTALAANFIYANSTYLGQSLASNGSNTSISTLFHNPYGDFIGYIKYMGSALTQNSLNMTCNGLVYNSSNISVCSAYVNPIGNTGQPIGLLNETEITPNYIASLYSFVTGANLTLANENGLNLVLALNLSKSSFKWTSAYRDTCVMANTLISCTAISFNHTSDRAGIGITSNLAKQIRLNSISCSANGSFYNASINQSLAPGATVALNTTCHNIIVPVVEAKTTYLLLVNYTYNGQIVHDYGELNISNFAV